MRFAALIALALVGAARADTFYPMLMSVAPVAVQAGTTTECEVRARYNLHGAYRVFVTGDGVTGEAEPQQPDPKAPNTKRPTDKIKVKFKVAPDATPGAREVRIATP